jgi:DNA-binding response OmpR family regulator
MDLLEALGEAGFDATAAATLGEAREKSGGPPFALVLLDVILPDGDGVSFLEQLRAKEGDARHTPVMMLSTEGEIHDRVRGLKKGADEYVGKPYDVAFIIARAKELARKHGDGVVEGEEQSVLLIEANQASRHARASLLGRAGYRVLATATGEDGLRALIEARPTAVIVDDKLPGIDGATVIRRIRLDAVARRTPCLMLMGADDRNAELLALEAGADSIVRHDDDDEFVLARLAQLLRGATPAEAAAASFMGPKRVLAVDDSPTYLDAVANELRDEGYDVVLAKSGADALELLAVQPVDCILLDLMMPEMSGDEACRRIKSTPGLREIPLMILTAVEERQAMLESINAGADDYVPKSADADVLKARVRAQLRRRQFESENRHFREQLLLKEAEAREARANRELAEMRATLLLEVEAKNKELEAFSYSVSHDLRAPLRAIEGFSQVLEEQYSGRLDEQGRRYLERVRAASRRMGQLIDDFLKLSRITRSDLRKLPVDLGAMAREVLEELARRDPDRRVERVVTEPAVAQCDPRLLRVVLENLIGNAWKFTGKKDSARIEFGTEASPEGWTVYFVRDDGAGFDMAYAGKLFAPFQRLHDAAEFEGTGIGLATIERVIHRHGGHIWAEGVEGKGAVFRFRLEGGAPP